MICRELQSHRFGPEIYLHLIMFTLHLSVRIRIRLGAFYVVHSLFPGERHSTGISISIVPWSVRLEFHRSSLVDPSAVVSGSSELWKLFIDFNFRSEASWS